MTLLIGRVENMNAIQLLMQIVSIIVTFSTWLCAIVWENKSVSAQFKVLLHVRIMSAPSPTCIMQLV